MQARRWIGLWLLTALAACDDGTSSGSTPVHPDAAALADAGGAGDAARVADAGGDAAPPDAAPEPAGFVELRLTPQQAVYGLADRPQVEAQVFDRVGAPLAAAELDWRVVEPAPMPGGPIATLDAEHRLTFLREGPGASARAPAATTSGSAGACRSSWTPALRRSSSSSPRAAPSWTSPRSRCEAPPTRRRGSSSTTPRWRWPRTGRSRPGWRHASGSTGST
ncbi:MAG: hypothetical protein R3F60_15620 [bacterium]